MTSNAPVPKVVSRAVESRKAVLEVACRQQTECEKRMPLESKWLEASTHIPELK